MGIRVALIYGLLARAAGWRSAGELPTDDTFVEYAGKFCFDYYQAKYEDFAGWFSLHVAGRAQQGPGEEGEYPVEGRLWLFAYSDQRAHWQAARHNFEELTCWQRHHFASYTFDLTHAMAKHPHEDGEFHLMVNTTIRQGARPRFWYFFFENCGAHIDSPIKFEIHAVNHRQGFQAELGLDEKGSLNLQIIFSLAFSGIVIVGCFASRSRAARLNAPRSRPLLQLLQFSAGCSAIGCMCSAVHWYVLCRRGVGVYEAQVLGTLFAGLSKAAFTVLQFFLAKGWALCRPDEACQRTTIIAVLTSVIGLSVGCEIHEQYFHDQRTAFYLYEDWTGLLILALNLGLLAVAWCLMSSTYQNETVYKVREFYRIVSGACGIYFASLPVITLVATVLEPWVVRKYIERFELTARFWATFVLLYCLWPSRLDLLIAARLKTQGKSELMLGTMENGGPPSQESEPELEECDDDPGTLQSSRLTQYAPPCNGSRGA